MATYENGYEEKEESAQMTEDDLSYKDKYEDHQSVLNLLSSCQEADHDNREMSREAHLFLIRGMVSGNRTGGKPTRTSHATLLIM